MFINEQYEMNCRLSYSFVKIIIYIVYLSNWLPFSNGVKVGITATMMVTSEIAFWIGGMMLGKEIVMKVRKKISLKNFIQYIKK